MAEAAEHSPIAHALWQVRLDAPVSQALMPLADGVLVPLRRGARASIRRMHVDDGENVWETMFDGPLVAGLARTGDVVAVPLTEGRLVALDVQDGSGHEVQWAQQMGEFCDPVLARQGKVYVRLMSGTGTKVQAFQVGQPSPVWGVEDPTASAPDARLGHAQGVVVMAGTNGSKQVTVAGLDDDSGALKWTNGDAEGKLQDLFTVTNLIDVVTDADGILGVNARTGKTRNQRFADFPFERAFEVGETLLMVTKAKGQRVMFAFSSLGEQIQGRLREPLERIVGCSPSEVLVTMADGTPALYSLPDLKPVEMPEADVIGPCNQVAFARDVAYFVSEDRHTITAIDLEAV